MSAYKSGNKCKSVPRLMALLLAPAVLLSAGCDRYVKRSEFEATVYELRGETQQLRAEDQRSRLEMVSLRKDLSQRFALYDTKVTQTQSAVRIDMSAYFEPNETTVREADKPKLRDFAKAVLKTSPDAVVTVEGFTDSAGSAAYNRQLGKKRAEAVREYLVQNGLPASNVRTVSYGESKSRQIAKANGDDAGYHNRRVALVVDYAAPKT
jgi:peptidoglycan-associated lipoprotein